MKIHWQVLKGKEEAPWLVLDLLLLFLISLNLSWLLLDAILLNSGSGVMLARAFPDFIQHYREHWHTRLQIYDSFFTFFLIGELLLRWLHAIWRKTYYRWFFYPFVRWYDVLGCIPIPAFRALRLLAAVEGKWSLMFLWLVVALVVDGIDGPLARKYQVKVNWPTYDGVLMDLIIDYLTYVFIPAYALFKSGLLSGWTGWFAIITIVYGSVIYFADTRMKTKDNSFSGFPGCWNMVVLVLFATDPHWTVILLIVVTLTVAMFLPIRFVHPVRTERWRAISLRRWPGALSWRAPGLPSAAPSWRCGCGCRRGRRWCRWRWR